MDAFAEKVKATVVRGVQATPALVILAVLVLIVLYIIWMVWKKEGFTSNFATGGNMPLWWYGSADAGNWGSVHRDITPMQASIYEPQGCAAGSPCGSWDPSAKVEAQALATANSLSHSDNAEGPLQSAINQTFECDGLSDTQLSSVMHSGGAP